MKTKFLTRLSTFALILVVCFMALVGCVSNLEMPETNAPVTGNGGLVVQKGDYLYFVNGYKTTDDMVDGDNRGGEKYAAIYRVKLGENNTLSYNEDGELENCELVIDKICGFEKTALYIFGDYIYYATPNTDKVASGDQTVSNFKLTDFYRAKLDGTSRTLIYKTNLTSTSTKFAFYKVNGVEDVYLSLFDGTKLVFVNCGNKAITTVCDSVASVAMPKYDVYNAQNNQISVGASYVYYTRSGTDEEDLASGNVLCCAKIGENQEKVLASGTYTYSVVSANNDALFLTKKLSYESNANNYVLPYAYDAQGNIALDAQNGGTQLDSTAHSTIFIATFENGNSTGIITTNSTGKLLYIKLSANGQKTYEILNEEKNLTPLAVSGSFVYAYDGENNLYQINYKAVDKSTATTLLVDNSLSTEEEPIKTPYFSATKNFSVCGSYAYYFATYAGDDATGYYLNRVITSHQETYKQELVGVVQDNHIVAEQEEE